MKKIWMVLTVMTILAIACSAFAETAAPATHQAGFPQQTEGRTPGHRQDGRGPGGHRHGNEKPGDSAGQPGEAPEKPTGEKPTDAPQEPADPNGAPPALPQMGGQPTMGEQAPTDMVPGAPDMIDFDAMVTQGVITQETRDKIKTYMNDHTPQGESPQASGQTVPTAADAQGGLLAELLNAGVITEEEYAALIAARTTAL